MESVKKGQVIVKLQFAKIVKESGRLEVLDLRESVADEVSEIQDIKI